MIINNYLKSELFKSKSQSQVKLLDLKINKQIDLKK